MSPPRDRPGARLWWCSLLHLVNDGYLESLTLLLPFIALDLNLSFAEAGLLRAASEGAMATTQIPAGFLAERCGELIVLGLGTGWYGLSYLGMTGAVGFVTVLLLLISAGAGAGVYHPVGTATVANAYPDGTGRAIGLLNFSGDVGKVIFPALAGILVAAVGWRGTFAGMGGLGLIITALFLLYYRHHIREPHYRRREEPGDAGWGILLPRRFVRYTAIGLVDVVVRTGAVTFLGFQLLAAGTAADLLGWMISLLFVGGALGKLLCGRLVDRWGERGVILATEAMTIIGCLLLPALEGTWLFLLFLPLFGFALNGTSSVIYIGLAPTLSSNRRGRGYAVYFTLNFAASAAAPFAFGLLADHYGLERLFHAAAGLLLLTLPLLLLGSEESST